MRPNAGTCSTSPGRPTPRRGAPSPSGSALVRPGVQRILDAMTDVPADVRNGRGDILAANWLGSALYSELYLDPVRPANVARFLFLSPRPVSSFPTGRVWPTTWWPICALRPAATPHWALQDLVGELSTAARSSARVGGPQRAPAPDRPQAAAITRLSGTSS